MTALKIGGIRITFLIAALFFSVEKQEIHFSHPTESWAETMTKDLYTKFDSTGAIRYSQNPKGQYDDIWAFAMLLSFSIHWPNFGMVPVSFVVGLAKFPSAYRALRRHRLVRRLLLLTVVALTVGVFLRFTIAVDIGYAADLRSAAEVGIWILSILVLSVAGAYALGILGMRRGLLLFAASSLVGNWLYYGTYYSQDPQAVWKFVAGYSISLIIVLMTVSGGALRVFGTILVAAGLAVTSMSLGSRSLGVVIIIAALFALHRRKKRVPLNSKRIALHAFVTLAVVSAVAWFLTTAMGKGWFGDQLQGTYMRETAHGSGLLLGGRIESVATLQLLQLHNVGFGLGTRLSDGFLNEALAAIAHGGGDAYNPYYSSIVFGQRVDLHSMAADLWFHCGYGGLALAVCVGLILVMGSVVSASSTRNPIGFACQILIWQAIWDLAFSPMGNIDRLCAGLMVAIALLDSRENSASRSGEFQPGSTTEVFAGGSGGF